MHKKISSYEVAYIFNQVCLDVTTTEKGVSGFKSTGIYLPYTVNPGRFKDEEIVPKQNLEHLVIDDEQVSCLAQNDVGLSPTTDNRNLPQADVSEELAIYS
ncbi:hypothetical protein AVEN_17116-1 [Araneus ventricosus]|uniref:Uncharacterized protein n=1 Tax=Araneus ventricosus TaxID=182803 RepID=A0A4Y2NH80_ARAVE|nr:hypothetical protein AVEN_17116-1 [Araneus ventricosus]